MRPSVALRGQGGNSRGQCTGKRRYDCGRVVPPGVGTKDRRYHRLHNRVARGGPARSCPPEEEDHLSIVAPEHRGCPQGATICCFWVTVLPRQISGAIGTAASSADGRRTRPALRVSRRLESGALYSTGRTMAMAGGRAGACNIGFRHRPTRPCHVSGFVL